MEHRHTTHTGVVLIVAVAVMLLHTAADCFAANPHIGIWKFNQAKSKMHAGVTKNNTITYSEQGDKLKRPRTAPTVTAHAATAYRVGRFDGKAYPVTGNPHHNAERYSVINDHTAAIEGLQDGKVDVVGNHHDLERWQNAHGDPSLARREREEAYCEKGL